MRGTRFLTIGILLIYNRDQSFTSVVLVTVRVTSLFEFPLRKIANSINTNTTPPASHTQGFIYQFAGIAGVVTEVVVLLVEVLDEAVVAGSWAKAAIPAIMQKDKKTSL